MANGIIIPPNKIPRFELVTTMGHTVNILHADYTSVEDFKPSDTSREWHLIGVLTSSASVKIIGWQGVGVNRFMAITDSAQTVSNVALMLSWIGI